MGSIASEIASAIEQSGAHVSLAGRWKSTEIFAELAKRFADPNKKGELWEQLASSFGYRDENAWQLIAAFAAKRSCLLTVPPRVDRLVAEFEDGSDLVRVLNLCSGFVFYVTDDTFSFLLCANDHGYLIAAGTAEEWLRQRASCVR